jgi:hypothetical protein
MLGAAATHLGPASPSRTGLGTSLTVSTDTEPSHDRRDILLMVAHGAVSIGLPLPTHEAGSRAAMTD